MFVDTYPKANSKTRTEHFEIFAGGPATNAAITCTFLGRKVSLVSPVGKHFFSKNLISDIKKNKVRLIDPIKNTESEPLLASIITDNGNGDRTIISYQPTLKSIHFDSEEHINFKEYSIALFDGFYIDLSLMLLKKLKENNITTVLDGGSWKPGLENLLPLIDIAICSNDFYPPDTNKSFEVIDFLKNFKIGKIAITNGHRPIIMSENGIIKEIPVQQIKCVDSLGAGDVFHGAFCYFYTQNNDFALSLAEASKVASFSCTHRGTRLWMEQFKM